MAQTVKEVIAIARDVDEMQNEIRVSIKGLTDAFDEIESNYNCGFITENEHLWQKVDAIMNTENKIGKSLTQRKK